MIHLDFQLDIYVLLAGLLSQRCGQSLDLEADTKNNSFEKCKLY